MKKDSDCGSLAISRRSSITLGAAAVGAPLYDGIKAFSETDQTEEAIEVPTLCMQGGDDQILPCKDAVEVQVKSIKNSICKA